MSGDVTRINAHNSAEAHAIRLCLDELGAHAEAQGLTLAANLIGAASRAISDEIFQKEVAERVATASEGLAVKAK
ncbi:MAG: hypothetical protein QNJ67_02870 [Kiloniellales bacterium]|nr:hypothetical protein [Kiloniellales bacterium]